MCETVRAQRRLHIVEGTGNGSVPVLSYRVSRFAGPSWERSCDVTPLGEKAVTSSPTRWVNAIGGEQSRRRLIRIGVIQRVVAHAGRR
jgi:hypothetical protein